MRISLLLCNFLVLPLPVLAEERVKLRHGRIVVFELQAPTKLRGTVYGGLLSTFSSPVDVNTDLQVSVPAQGNEEGCLSHVDSINAGANSADVRLSGSVVIVRRGKCTFLEKAQHAQDGRAEGIIIVSDAEEVIDMDGNGTTDTLNIFALSVKRSIGDELLSLTKDASPIIKFQYYESSGLDISEALVVVLATGLVIAGAFFSTADLRSGSPLAPKKDEVLEVSGELAFGWCAMGSVMLVILFFCMAYMIYVIMFAFCIGGGSCLVQIISACLQYYSNALRLRAFNFPSVGPVARADVVALIPTITLVIGWLRFRNSPQGWFFQDIIGAGFLCMMQRTLRLPNIQVATILLSLMFFFDIFWVFLSPLFFRTSVMVEVAKGGGTNEMVPMLLRIPSIGDPLGHDRMLGFGDIALPGLLVSYCLRHDVLSHKRLSDGYFMPCVVGYALGLLLTLAALLVMQMGQPALLYLVPGTLGTTLVLGWKRGELGLLWKGMRANDQDTILKDPAGVIEFGNILEDCHP